MWGRGIVILILLGTVEVCQAQEVRHSSNAVYLEVFGNGGMLSVNYERRLTTNLHVRVGTARWTAREIGGPEVVTTVFPILGSYVAGHNSGHFEIGGGVLIGNQQDYSGVHRLINLTSFIGCRYQEPDKGFLFRIGLTPFVSVDNEANYPNEGFFLSAGISVGYHF